MLAWMTASTWGSLLKPMWHVESFSAVTSCLVQSRRNFHHVIGNKSMVMRYSNSHWESRSRVPSGKKQQEASTVVAFVQGSRHATKVYILRDLSCLLSSIFVQLQLYFVSKSLAFSFPSCRLLLEVWRCLVVLLRFFAFRALCLSLQCHNNCAL